MTTQTINIINHPQYAEHLKQWQLVRDAASETGVKDAQEKYLPFIGDKSDDADRDAYKRYLQRAQYYGFTQETLSGLLGLAFRQGVTLEETESLSYIENDIDGDGVGLEQQAKKSVSDVNAFGRAGLLVDFPPVGGALTVAEQNALGARATISQYNAFAIRNWSITKRGAVNVLSLVSLSEVVDELDEDGLTVVQVEQERRLILDDDGYRVEVHKFNDEIEIYEPRDFNGNRFDYIPFYFIGSLNNDHRVDSSPIFPIADLNIGHYRNSADYENAVFLLQPQPWATGLNDNWIESHLKGFRMGSGSLFVGPQDSSFGIAQPEPNQTAFEAMQYKQSVMVSLGAKLINSDVSFNSATEAIIANSSENGKLQTVIDNVEKAYQGALESLAQFMGGDAPVFTINTDLSATIADPNLAKTMVDAWMGGLISKEDARDYMRKTSLIERNDEEIDDLMEMSDNGLSLDA